MANLLEVPSVAVIFTAFVEVTAVELIANVVVVAPAGTVAVPATITDALEEVICITSPWGPALPARVTVPVANDPPLILFGLTVTLVIAGVVTVKVSDTLSPKRLALMAPVVDLETGKVVNVNVALDFPAGIITVAGTDNAGLPLTNEMTSEPMGTGPERLTVTVVVAPPTRVVGLDTIDTNFAAG